MSFINIFRHLEVPDFSWIFQHDGEINVDRAVGFGCLMCFGFAVAFGA